MGAEPRYPQRPRVVYTLHAHLAFVTKSRRGAFTDEILGRCEQIMHEVL
ncbi:Transposase IS200 like [Lentzea albidocapillata subsp. violacea]|uniref:Transposase IS200 like n=1 Tax=Lentzea albidocapillata subsp. violacea TaxID=128104 RepID=A0A1G8QPN7_9PSEU|nr:Transposase IS200 like [Lentzea albidocapillata subsp. violacea]